MRAACPDYDGYADADGVRIFYEVYGDRHPETFLLMAQWAIVPARTWKAQVPFLSRHFRVVVYDGLGSGRSDKPADDAHYSDEAGAIHALAVLDATGTERAILFVDCGTAGKALLLATGHPGRIAGAIWLAPALPITPPLPERTVHSFWDELDTGDGWAKHNIHYWRRDFRGWLEFLYAQCYPEPHSTKQIDDGVEWGLGTTPDVLARTLRAPSVDQATTLALMERLDCPTLVLQGTRDLLVPVDRGPAFADGVRGARFVSLDGSGHYPPGRVPVPVNLLAREFANAVYGRTERNGRGPRARTKRALFISSPIGLGHAHRDIAIARELRALVPGLEIEWLAQDPVTRALASESEVVHPASGELASESAHLEAEAGEHELNAFDAIRRMDEILLANFMLFHDVVRERDYDLWIADEGWEIDHFLHEHPGLKTARFAWLTDVVGWAPLPAGGEREAFLTADYNAEMVEHVRDHPGVRDRSIFVGDPEDLLDDALAPGLPSARDWAEEHFAFSGYITGFDAAELSDRQRLRDELGWSPDERVCVATVGGSGVGEALLGRVIAAHPHTRKLVPGFRMVVVAGPRIDPSRLPAADGLEVLPYVHNLRRLLAACDVAIAQGGLATTMELTACGRPFVYFPLKRHFEQQLLVPRRLRRHHAGVRMDYDESPPELIAQAIASELECVPTYVPVPADGARRAAGLIAELL